LRNLEYALPKDEISALATPKGVITLENDEAGILKIVKQADPARVLYNALVPFLVASALARTDPPMLAKS
jgi:hypothetical protein